MFSFLYAPRPFVSKDKRRAITDLLDDATPSRDFYLLVIGAILLATAGILLDSIPVLIASMVVAPLATPILAFALGLAVGDARLLARSFGMFVLSVCFALILAGIGGYAAIRIFGMSIDPVFVSFSPNVFFDVTIALISGAIAAYGLIRPKVGAAMTGIGIAVSLMPPLVASGIGVAISDVSLASRASLIFSLNVLGILAASTIVFSIFGLRREHRALRATLK